MALSKTRRCNFYYLPFRDATRQPIFVSHRVWLLKMKRSVEMGRLRTGVVKVGFGGAWIFDRQHLRSIWQVSGKVVFKGKTQIDRGSKVSVGWEDCWTLTRTFFTAESTIVEQQSVRIGDEAVSWHGFAMAMFTEVHQQGVLKIYPTVNAIALRLPDAG
jgi:hypothetical protein